MSRADEYTKTQISRPNRKRKPSERYFVFNIYNFIQEKACSNKYLKNINDKRTKKSNTKQDHGAKSTQSATN